MKNHGNSPPWKRFIYPVHGATQELCEHLVSLLWEAGASGTEIRDNDTFSELDGSGFERAGREHATVIAYFSPDCADPAPLLSEELKKQVGCPSVEHLDPLDWSTSWRQYFQSTQVSERIVVRPSWEEGPEEKGEGLVLTLDPGMAFGTGTHETTQLCLRALDRLLKKDHGKRLLDVGCGSGILCLAAHGLGVQDLLGIDIDPVAVSVARKNWSLNGFGPTSEAPFSNESLSSIGSSYDLIIANMLSNILLDLRDPLIDTLHSNSILIVSGVLAEEAQRFISRFAVDRIRLTEQHGAGEWTQMEFVKR